MMLEGGLWLRGDGGALTRDAEVLAGIDVRVDDDGDIDEGGWGRPDDRDEFSSSRS
jgi:hypothetical protein